MCRKSAPNMGGHFPRVGSPLPTWEGISDTLKNRFRMSMNSLVPRYTPLLLSTDLAADETIRLTIAMFVSRQALTSSSSFAPQQFK